MKQRNDIPPNGEYNATLDTFGENKDGELVVRAVIDCGRFRGTRISTLVEESNKERALRYLESLHPKKSRFRVRLFREIVIGYGKYAKSYDEPPSEAANMRVMYSFEMVNKEPSAPAEYFLQTRSAKFIR